MKYRLGKLFRAVIQILNVFLVVGLMGALFFSIGLTYVCAENAPEQILNTPECFEFTRNIKYKDSSADVSELQKFLNTQGFVVSTTGYFGPITRSVVQQFQTKFLGESLSTGFVGVATRQKINEMSGCTSAQPLVLSAKIEIATDTTSKIESASKTESTNRVTSTNTNTDTKSVSRPKTIELPRGTYDVVIVGAGSGGVAAALQAARLGAKVALLEETNWVGGQMIPVGNMDGGVFPQTSEGIYGEFRSNIRAYYADKKRFPPNGKSVSTCYWSTTSNCFEPKVVQLVLKEMLAKEKNITLFLNTKVVSVMKSGNTVTGVTSSAGTTWKADVVIDATEYGDVIPLAGVQYRSGNSLSPNFQSTSCIDDITYVVPVKKYLIGVPTELHMTNPPPKYDEYKNEFKRIVAVDGSSTLAGGYPIDWFVHVMYRGLPDSSNPGSYTGVQGDKITKTNVNYANDYPAYATYNPLPPGKLYTLPIAYLENPTERVRLNCEAKLKTLNFLYYMQNELGQTQWAVANDQGFDSGNTTLCDNIPNEYKSIERQFPPFPYVRESRRIVPIDTLTAKEIKTNKATSPTIFPTAVATGDYATDLHNCRDTINLESDLGETKGDSSPQGPFQIPVETLIPKTVDGFLAAEKNIGTSRLANGSTRLQPVTMHIGQAAGALAALAAEKNIQPRNVRPIDVQNAVVSAKNVVSRYVFTDIPLTHMFWKAIQLVSARGVVLGDSTNRFSPDTPLTRGEAAVLLVKRFSLPVVDTSPLTPSFEDVSVSNPYYKEIEAIYRAGFTAGCSSSPHRFCSDTSVKRAEFAVFLYKGLGFSPVTDLQVFEDVPPTHFAYKMIQSLYKKGMFAGCSATPRRFCPTDALTRAQAAAFLSSSLLSQ